MHPLAVNPSYMLMIVLTSLLPPIDRYSTALAPLHPLVFPTGIPETGDDIHAS
jgi:hypothetical protein